MRILIVEDIDPQAFWLIEKLKTLAPGAQISHIRTESAFQDRFDEIRASPPDLVFMDMMVRWADPEKDMRLPPDDYPGFHRAGLRCVSRLQGDPVTAHIPVIITTVLEDVDFDADELPQSVTLVTKEVDPARLMEEIISRLDAVPAQK
jgi:CheY-like chemotaxis protein